MGSAYALRPSLYSQSPCALAVVVAHVYVLLCNALRDHAIIITQTRNFFFKQKTAYEISACLVGSEMCIRDRYNASKIYSPVGLNNIAEDPHVETGPMEFMLYGSTCCGQCVCFSSVPI